MILVTAATGRIGTHVVRKLLEGGHEVRVLARDPSRVSLSGRGVAVVAGDLDRPGTLAPAFDGVAKLFLLSPGPNIPTQDAALVGAARQAKVEHVVMLTSLGVELGGIAGGRPHIPGEKLLAESGLPFTLLHPSEFMTNTLWWAGSIKGAGAIFHPSGSGKVGFVDPVDIGEVGAHVLTTEGHAGKTYRLTGPAALTTADLAATVAEVIGKPVRHVDVSEGEWRDQAAGMGTPPPVIEMMVEYCAAIRAGKADIVTRDVESLVERPPHTFAEWARANADAFR
jgi:(4-alkanoyl-5-oxo-2,5-dihydrofuran-3-yl)methyl phosphate reductase